METIFGVTPARGGTMTLDGPAVRAAHARATPSARGVYLAPEDRKRHGLVLPMSVAAEHLAARTSPATARWGWLDRDGRARRSPRPRSSGCAPRRPASPARSVNLSGGNQQKVVLGKWLAMSPKVLILDEPTRGIDVGAKAEIYRHMAALADGGNHDLDGQLGHGRSHRHERSRASSCTSAASWACSRRDEISTQARDRAR